MAKVTKTRTSITLDPSVRAKGTAAAKTSTPEKSFSAWVEDAIREKLERE